MTQIHGYLPTCPTKDFYGIDQFVYEICGSSELQCDEATETIEVIQIPLPVDFLAFTAAQLSFGEIQLSWSTAKEKENEYFEVEYSIDPLDWINAGKIEGHGYTNEVKEYQYLLPQLPVDKYYFRIKQVDFDGSMQYSEVIPLVSSPKSKKIKLYPNPAGKTLNIEGEAEEKIFKITNTLGQNMDGKVITNKISDQKTEINVSGLKSGIYMLRTWQSSYIFSKD